MRLNFFSSDKAKLALTMAGILLFIGLLQPTLSEWFGKDKNSTAVQPAQAKQNPTELTQTSTPTVPALMPGADPFKAHIEKNGFAPSSAASPASNVPNPNTANPAGADPFKAFLEKQKQASKDAGVSPFGK